MVINRRLVYSSIGSQHLLKQIVRQGKASVCAVIDCTEDYGGAHPKQGILNWHHELALDKRPLIGVNQIMMTPESLKAWRERMRWSKATAADALGLSVTGYFQYETGKPLAGKKDPRPIPKTVALACAAITHRIQPEE